MAVSERCEKCKSVMGFPSSREVLAKTRDCPVCGHTQRVEKSILYVVETLEEQVEWLSERLQVLETKAGVMVPDKPLPVPKRTPVIHPPRPEIDLFGGAPTDGKCVDFFDFAAPTHNPLKDLI